MARYTVAASTDDAQEDSAGAVDPAALNCTLVVPNNPYTGVRFSSVFRFEGLGSIVMQVAADTTKNFDMDADVYCEAADNAAAYAATTNNVSSRTRTTTKVIWKATLRAGPSVYSTSPDLTPIVMEVMNRAGWVDGNAINFIFVARSASICVFNSQDNSKNVPPFIDLLPSAPVFDTREAPGHLAPTSAWHTQMYTWGDRGPDVPAYPFAEQKPARTVRGFRPPPGKRAETIRPQENPPIPVQEIVRFKPLRGYPRRGKSAEPVRAQMNPPFPHQEIKPRRDVRGLTRKQRLVNRVPPQFNPVFLFPEIVQRRWRMSQSRRAKPVEVVPPQVNPPFPFSELKPTRSPRALARRGKNVVPTRDQVNPPYPFAEVVARRLRGLRPRKAKPVELVPPQFNPPYPHAVVVQPRRARGLFRRGKVVTPVPPQFNPPFPFAVIAQARRLRGALRRAKPVEVVTSQAVTPTNPDFVPSRSQSRALRGLLRRRPRSFERTPAQEFVAPTTSERRRAAVRAKPKPVQTVPPQFNPPFPFSELKQPRWLRTALRRGRTVIAIPGQAAPIDETKQPRRPRGLTPPRTKRWETTPPQFNPPFPHAVVHYTRVVRGLLRRKAKPVETVTPQQPLVPNPAITWAIRQRRIASQLRRAGKSFEPGGPQLAPVPEIAQPRRARGQQVRRARAIETVPPQRNPPFPYSLIRPVRLARVLARRGKTFAATPTADGPITELVAPRRLRVFPRRGRAREVVPGQPAVITPTITFSPSQPRRIRGMLRRAGRSFETVRTQLNPPAPPATIHQPRQLRGLLRRGRVATPTPAQLAPLEEQRQPRRARGLFSRRAKPVDTVPRQLNPPFPHARIAQPRRPRSMFQARGRSSFPFKVIPPATVARALKRPLRAIAVNASRAVSVFNRRREADPLNAERTATPKHARNVADPLNPTRESEQ